MALVFIIPLVKDYQTDDIIFALATPWAKGAIAVIRVSGEGCIERLEKNFRSRKPLSSYRSSTAVYGSLAGLDDCVITVYRNGHGYTGEEACEISCHGGLETIRAVLSYLLSIGFREAKGGEFTLRAFLHAKMDLTRAEAVNELINSRSANARETALSRLNGSLFSAIEKIRNIILDVMGTVEVQLDYAEDEIGEDLTFPTEKVQEAIDCLNRIKSTYKAGRLYSQGAKIVLAGSANAGKSSLFNFFLKEERAIVSQVPGTTRDFIEAQCEIDGLPVRLYDTAGLRQAGDFIEEEGIRRSNALIADADLIIYLKDPCDELGDDPDFTNDSRCIYVHSKNDLKKTEGLSVSVVSGEGFSELCSEISKHLKQGIETFDQQALVIESQRQKDDIERAVNSLETVLEHVKINLPLDIVALDIQEALEALGEITGEVTTDDILDKIFSSFCVGK